MIREVNDAMEECSREMGELLLNLFLEELIPKQTLAWLRAHESEGRAGREGIHAQWPRGEGECGMWWAMGSERRFIRLIHRIQMRVFRHPVMRLGR